MIKDIGIDIVHLPRFADKIDNQMFIEKILGDEEIQIYHSIVDTSKKIEFLASRFSVKESVFKALSEENYTLTYHNVQVLYKPSKKPFIKTSFSINGELLVSISHDGDYVITQVIYQINN